MTRRETSAPGARSARRLVGAIVLGLAGIVGACGSDPAATPTDRTTAPEPDLTAPAASPAPTPTPAVPASEQPASAQPVTPEPEPDPTPTAEPVPTAEPEPSEEPARGAAACTGTDENRAFYSAVASAVEWSVFCPSLPGGWFVRSGQYRLSDGGRLEIAYRGPDGAGLMLQEGAFCAVGDCAPPGDELGETPFGDRSGTLIRTADGFAVIVDRGERPSWLLRVTGQREEAVRAIAADLVRVGD